MTPWQKQYAVNLCALNLESEVLDALLLESHKQHTGLKCRSGDQLKRHLLNFVASVPGLAAIYKNFFDKESHEICAAIQTYPRLYEQIHIMELVQPTNYYHSLFSALAGYAIALELGLPQNQKELALQAGLFHDVGLLYYAPTDWYGHLNETTHLNSAMRAHGPVGAGVVRRMSNAPTTLEEIIKNHHERSDGTGYPRATPLIENQILCAIVAITDLFVRASDEYRYYPDHVHQLTRLVIQLNESNFPREVYKATVALTRHKADQTTPPHNRPAIEDLLAQRSEIIACVDNLSEALRLLVQNETGDQNRSLIKLQQHVKDSMCKSGLDQEEYAAWLTELFGLDSLDMMNMNIMQNEICHLLGRLFTATAEHANELTGLQKSLKTQLRDLLMRTRLPGLVSP